MTTQDPAKQAGIFLRNLFAPYESGYIEIRAFSGFKREQSFHEIPISGDRLRGLCESLIEKSDNGYDIYVGVLPRKERYGRASSVEQAATIWGDFDFKNMDPAEIKVSCGDADILVHSGGGIHAYWYTTDVQDVSSTRKQDAYSAVVQAMQNERSGGRADHTHDLPRILRLPGTKNWKVRSEPKPVRLISCNSRVMQKQEPQEKQQPVDTEFIGLLEEEPMYSPLVPGTAEHDYFTRLAWEAYAQNRLYEAAKEGKLPVLSSPVSTSGGRAVQDLNHYVVMQMERVMKSYGTLSEEEMAFCGREIQSVLEFLRSHGHAY